MAGKAAFSEQGLGCASCHGDLAQGQRGPASPAGAGSRTSAACTRTACSRAPPCRDRDFQAIDAWLRTLQAPAAAGDEG